jgi:hypothetical protein
VSGQPQAGPALFGFSLALSLMKDGARVSRTGWNGPGQFVYHVPAASYPAHRNGKHTLVGDYPDDMVPYREYLALRTVDGSVVPWTPSVSDVLAEDWVLVRAPQLANPQG